MFDAYLEKKDIRSKCDTYKLTVRRVDQSTNCSVRELTSPKLD